MRYRFCVENLSKNGLCLTTKNRCVRAKFLSVFKHLNSRDGKQPQKWGSNAVHKTLVGEPIAECNKRAL